MTIKEQLESLVTVMKQPNATINKMQLVTKLMQLQVDIEDESTPIPDDVFSSCDDEVRRMALMGLLVTVSAALQSG